MPETVLPSSDNVFVFSFRGAITEGEVTIAQVLRAAAVVVRHGWCQGSKYDAQGNACAYGAIEPLSWCSGFIADEPARFVEAALGLTAQTTELRPLAFWNDAEGQTAENVAAGLEYAALIWEQEARESAAPRHPEVMAGAAQ